MEPIIIFAALRWECTPILRALRQVSRDRVGPLTVWRAAVRGREVVVVKTGVGVVQAAAAAQTIASAARCGLFVSTGCAGALAPELQPGALVAASAVIDAASGEHFATDLSQRAAIERGVARVGTPASMGALLCSPEVLATAAAKRAAADAHGAVAVEMEGAPLARQARTSGVPFVAVRAVLDTADTELRHTGTFVDAQSGAVKPLALAGYLVRNPRALTDLLATQRMMQAAQRSLEQFFKVWFDTLDDPQTEPS